MASFEKIATAIKGSERERYGPRRREGAADGAWVGSRRLEVGEAVDALGSSGRADGGGWSGWWIALVNASVSAPASILNKATFAPAEMPTTVPAMLSNATRITMTTPEIASCVLCRSALVAEWFSSASSLLRICPCAFPPVKIASAAGVRGSGLGAFSFARSRLGSATSHPDRQLCAVQARLGRRVVFERVQPAQDLSLRLPTRKDRVGGRRQGIGLRGFLFRPFEIGFSHLPPRGCPGSGP